MSVTLHTQNQPPAITGQALTASWAGSSLASLVPLARCLGAWLALPSLSRWLLWTIRLSLPSVSPQVQGHPVHFSPGRPAGKGCDRVGPSGRNEVGVLQLLLYCAQEKWWVTTDLGSASFEPCASQAAIQDVDAELHFPSPRLVFSDRPEEHYRSYSDTAIPAIRIRLGISVQGPALWAVPVALRLYQSRGGSPCSFERAGGGGCTFSSILTTSSYSHSLEINCAHTGTWCSDTLAQGWF